MSAQPTSEPQSPEAVPIVTFRLMTPVFKYRVAGQGVFSHSGKFRDARFEILLRPYKHPTDFAEVMRYASPGIREKLEQFPSSHAFIERANHVLLVDVTRPATQEAGSLREPHHVRDAVEIALRLHSSAGLPSRETYTWCNAPQFYPALNTNWPYANHYPFSHLAAVSELAEAEFAACRATADTIINKTTWDNSITFDRVLSLALQYDRVCFTLERVEHAFLIVMVAFEALFKKDETENAAKAAWRIARLLGQSKKECNDIKRAFFDDPVLAYSKIRNKIAHGDPNLNLGDVETPYPGLHGYVKQAIIELLTWPPGRVDATKNYYDEIDRLVEARFNALRPT